MFRLTIKNLWAHKLRFALTGLAVVLGVAFMAGTLVLTDTMASSFDDLFDDVNAGIDVVVQQPGGRSEGDATQPGRCSTPTVVDAVGRRRRRRRRRPVELQGFGPARQGRRHGPSSDGSALTIGVNWIDDERAEPVRSGRRAHAPEARRRGRPRPSAPPRRRAGRSATRIDRDHPGRPRQPHPGRASPPSAASTASPALDAGRHLDATAQRALRRRPGTFDAIVVAADGVDATALADRHRPTVPPGRRRGDHRRPGHRRAEQAEFSRGPELLQHLPAGLRLHRPVRRHLHHLQHLLHRRRPADP